MSNSDIEYENDLADQLGWDEGNRAQYEVPYTILKYHKIIEANNRVSIFDTDDYNIAPPINDNAGGAPKSNPSDYLPDNGKVIRVISGRGRGGRSIYQKPGITANQEYEDVTRYLRKVAPLGYGNAITENALRQNRALKNENKENIQTATSGNSSNIINKKNNQIETASKATASTTTSSNSSEYFDSKDDLNNSTTEGTVSPELFKDNNNENTTSKEEPTKMAAVPLSEMLRKSREQYRKLRLQKLKNSEENGKIKLVKPPDTLL